MKFFPKTREIFIVVTASILIGAGFYVFAAPPASPYAPGETLAPTCLPGSLNCTVTTPFIASAGNEGNVLYLEGSTADSFEILLTGADATADRTITFPNNSGTVALTSDLLSVALTDNTLAAYSLAEGANNYFGISTVNGSEVINFGNATTNPDYTFTGTGVTNFQGPVDFDSYVDFNTTAGMPAYQEGRLYYDPVVKSLSYFTDESGIEMNIGQSLWARVKNATGSVISKGSIVYVSGTDGFGNVEVDLAIANDPVKTQAVGIVTKDIADGGFGFVTYVGAVFYLNTSSYTEGDKLYLSATTPGGLTTSKPSYPNYSMPIGVVALSHPTNGILGVNISANTSGAFTVGAITFGGSDGMNATDASNLFWDDTNNRLGIGDNTPTATLSVGSGDLFQVFGATGNITTAGDIALTGGGEIASSGPLTINSTTTNSISIDTGTTGAINIGTGANSKVITIGNSSGTSSLNLNSGSGNINLQSQGSGTSGNIQIGSGGAGSATPDYLALDVKSTSGDPVGGAEGYIYYNTADNKFRCYQGGGWTDCITVVSATSLSSLVAATADNTISNGDYEQTWQWQLTTADQAGLHIRESAASTAAGNPSLVEIHTLASSTARPLYIQNVGSADSFRVDDAGIGDTTPFVINNNGNVAIGAETFDPTNPERLKVVMPTGSTSFNVISGLGDVNNYLQLNIQNNNSGASASSDLVATADNGDESVGYVDLGINSSGYSNPSYSIGGANDAYLYAAGGTGTGGNLTIGTADTGTALIFHTAGTTAGDERMRIADDGLGNVLVGIGTTSPDAALNIAGEFRLDGATSGYVGFTAPAVAGSTVYELPVDDGNTGDILSTNGSGVLSWTSNNVGDDVIDFAQLEDTLNLDASTSLLFGAFNYVHNLDSTGDFIIQDNGTPFATFSDDGTITFGGNLTQNGTLTANNIFTLGDNGEVGSINTSDWDISTSGAASGIDSVTNTAALTITAGAASTWSTSAGALTIDSASALNLGTTNATSVVIGNGTNTTSITFNTDGTGDAEVVLPTGSISGTEILNDTVVLTTDTAGNYVATITAGNGISGSSSTEGGTPTLAVLLLDAADGTGGTSSRSGLEFGDTGDNELTLLQGCANGEILKWNDAGVLWECSSDNAGGGGANSFETISTPNGTSPVADSSTDTLTLSEGAGITITGTSGTDTITVGLDLTDSLTWTGSAYTFGDAVTDNLTLLAAIQGANALILDGSTDDTNETTIAVTDPTADNTITLPNSSGTVILSGHSFTGGDVTGTLDSDGTTALTVAADSVALGTDTTGNYVVGNTAGSGISVSGVAGEAWSPTIALGALTVDWNQTGAFDIVLNNASSELRIIESAGDTFYGTFDVNDLSADRTYTFPNATGTVITTGNISDISGLTDSQISDTLTSSIFIGSGSTTNAVDLGTAEVAGTLSIANGGTGQTTAITAFNALSPLTTKGDLLTNNGTNDIRLPIGGTNGHVLIVDSTQAAGMRWDSVVTAIGNDTLNFTEFSDSLTLDASTSIALAGNNLTVTDAGSGAISMTAGGAISFTGGAASSFNTTTGALTFQAAGSGTTSTVQIGVGGAGSVTPDFFALDVKSSTGDPVGGAEGYMYYNTTDNKFRCYENTGWKDCDTTGGTTTLQTAFDNGQTINLGALDLTLNANTTGDIRLQDGGTNRLVVADDGTVTITAGAASTWSTSTGALTIDSATALNLGTTNATSVSIGTSSTNTAINGSASVGTYLDFDTLTNPAHSEGRLFYDNTDNTLAYYNDVSGITLNIGQENWVRVYNSSGGTITSGQVVYTTGAVDDGSGVYVPTVSLAQSNSITSSDVIGIATHDFNNGTIGYITTFGLVHDLDTSTFSSGDVLYLRSDLAGGVTTTRPSQPNLTIALGRVVRSNATVGSILVDIGTRRSGAFSAGAVSFGGADGELISDSANFFWDNTNKRLGLGDATPSATLTVGSGDLFTVNGSNGNVTTSGDLNVNGGDISSSGTLTIDSASSITLGGAAATSVSICNTANCDTITIGSNADADTVTIGDSTDSVSLTSANWSVTTAGLITTAGDLALNGSDITTTSTGTATVFNTNATTLNIGGAATSMSIGVGGATAATIDIAGGSGATGCTVSGATGNLTCSGAITTTATSGNMGWWNRTGTTLSPTTAGDAITTTGNISTTSTGTITSAGLLTASNGLTLTTGALNLTATSGALTISGLSTSSITTSNAALTINTGTGTLGLSTDATANTINIGTGAGAKTVTIGSTNTTSTTTIQSGSGNIGLVANGTSTGNVQVGDGGAASATPDMLVLDTGSAEPTGTNGAMYYNTTSNKFRCYENGAWKDCDTTGGGGSGTVYNFSDTTLGTSWTDSDTVELWNDTVRPNLTPSSAGNEVLVMVSVKGSSTSTTGADDNNPHFRLDRETGVTASCDDINTIGPTVGTSIDGSGSSGVSLSFVGTYIFLDTPATTSNVSYTVCTSLDSTITDTFTATRIDITLYEVNNAADLAEVYSTNDRSLTLGDVVAIDDSLINGVKKTEKSYQSNAIGVVSTKPALVIGGRDNEGITGLPIALAGRIPVNAVSENGPIKAGDYLTSSSKPGYAMKATKSGVVIGQALTDLPYGEGKVLTFVKNAYYNGESDEVFTSTDALGTLAARAQTVAEATEPTQSSNISADRVAALEVVAPTVTVNKLVAGVIEGKAFDDMKLAVEGISKSIEELTLKIDAYETRIVTLESGDIALQAAIDAQASKLSELETSSLNQVNAISDLQVMLNGQGNKLNNLELRISDLESAGSDTSIDLSSGLNVNGLTVNSIDSDSSIINFLADVNFIGRPYFTTDTAGYATIKAGDDRVRVTFVREYLEQPVVTVSQVVDENKDLSDDLKEYALGAIFTNDAKFIVTNKDVTGFTIRLDKYATTDIQFNWIALAVKNGKTFISHEDAVAPVVVEPVAEVPATEITVVEEPVTGEPIVEEVVSEPAPEPVVEEVVVEPTPEPASEPVIELTPEPVVEEVVAVSEPISEPTTAPTPEPSPEPVAETPVEPAP